MDFVLSRKRKRKKNTNHGWRLFQIITLAVILIVIILFYFIFASTTSGRFTIVLVNESLTIVSLEQERNLLTVVTIPNDLYINLARGRGDLSTGSLYRFDQISQQKGSLLLDTLREFFGIPFDGYIKISNTDFNNVEDFIAFRNKEFTIFNPKLFSFTGNLTKLKLNIQKVRPDKITFINLKDSGIFQKEILPDGYEMQKTDQASLDSLLSENFYEWKIRKENLKIEVLNGGDLPGIATKADRIITNLGGQVVIVAEDQNKISECLIKTVHSKKNTYTVWRLAKIFNCKVLTEYSESPRSDITITLGKIYQNEIYGK